MSSCRLQGIQGEKKERRLARGRAAAAFLVD